MFGQVVIGAPGAGKTVCCNGFQQFLNEIGRCVVVRLVYIKRKTVVVNLDPANDSLPYECGIDINDLVKLSQVMEKHELGPNGG